MQRRPNASYYSAGGSASVAMTGTVGEGSDRVTRARRMEGDARTVGDVRTAVRSLMQDATPEVRDVAVLLTDELVTNAVVHGGGHFTVTAEVERDILRVAVADECPGAPRVLFPSVEQEHGRGMAIVEALASVWGTQQDGDSKVVWFELELRP
jgi:anti-sigma regulatory factor (Ser/Thr protein kinase)